MQIIHIDDLQLITGIDIPVEELGITIRQPKIKEIAILGEHQYFLALSIFKMNKSALNITNDEVTDWMIFNESLNQKIDDVKNTRTLITNFLQLFSQNKINIGPRSLILQVGDEIKNIEPEWFPFYQRIICDIGGASMLKGSSEEFKPADAKAAAIAKKIKESRARRAKMEPQGRNEGFLAKYIRAVATATSNSLDQVCNMTLLQLNEMMQTYLSWEAYDLEVKSRLAGAKGDKKLEHWITRERETNDGGAVATIEA